MAPDPAPPRRIRRGRMRALVAPGEDLLALAGPDGDPDRLLTSPRCELKKFQPKVVVGRMVVDGRAMYAKRYNVHALRVAVGSLGRPSPAWTAFENARALAARGFATPHAIAAVEYRVAGMLARSFFLTEEVAAARTADEAWREILAERDAATRRAQRRLLATELGRFYGRLHAAGVYHNDLKDVNVLVRPEGGRPAFVLLDLERVTVGAVVPLRRRVKNVVQLARTLGPLATRSDRLRWLRAYLGEAPATERRVWARRVLGAQRRKDRGRAAAATKARPTVACTIVCQDEAAQIDACLASVAWCDEIVVVDGGSRDATPAIVRARGARLLENPWPGYRAQKQFALDAARSTWVLSLDADERVSDELANEIRRVLATAPDGVDGYAVPRLVAYLGRWWWRGGWYPRPVLRLFRRERARWGGTDPHDRAEVPGRVGRLRSPIFHYTYDDVGDHLRTVVRFSTVAAGQVPAGRRVGAGRLAVEPGWRFVRSYLLKGGWREGLPGFFVAATDAFYVFLRWALVWERERRP